MSEAIKFFNKVIENRCMDIHTLMPCKVESFSNGVAKVIPLYKIKFSGQENASERPPLEDVPALKQRFNIPGIGETEVTPVYNPGDIVLVGFLERAFDMVRNGDVADPVFARKHALDDAVILGLF